MKNVIGSGGGCFPAGTMVMTPDGEVPINELVTGDVVMSFDHSGRVSTSVVEKIHTHPSDTVLKMSYWGGSVRITENHWVLNQYGAFATAGSMTEHDALIDSLGHLRPVLGFESDGVEPVYNLTVTPDHTFIADGIRVHNGGRGLTRPVIGGGGGDSKGGGGSSARAAIEDSDSLQSHQYAKIIDLLCEGPIGGLVDGLKSVYLNDTPVQAKDGTMNFSGVELDWRNGTNDQAPLNGFTDVENEYTINVEVKHGVPIVRTIVGQVDAARITIGLPALTQQDTSNGDLHGSSVDLAFEIQNNGGGYRPLPITLVWSQLSPIGASNSVSAQGQGIGMTLNLTSAFTEIWVEDPPPYDSGGEQGGGG